ncbi:DUF6344 domain-containing protein [Streptomyces sp. A012304]|uniref:DUF6344 domain-containing protein n=1 Tax=Streptomyces sp. A012304 TaxID=375446 RepID=UPI00222EF494|nr:DUF6344 domain-containing protein [Streptomyces sp. A012304]GKQ38702.1 hypothetical protein ALMP_52330 [Streptomyces sp. A012304]
MTDNRVKTLWTTIVTAFLALCTALGLITTTAPTAVARTEPARNSGENGGTVPPTASEMSPWSRLNARSLPPTMKQRIRAEAHGKSPGCRHRRLPDIESADRPTDPCDDLDEPADPDEPAASASLPLQR